MKQLSVLNDPIYLQPESYSRYERFWIKYINDKRDFPFIHLLTGIHLSVVPLGIVLLIPGLLPGAWWWAVFAVWFFIGHIKLRGPFGLMLHNITHRRLFKKKYNWLNKYVIWFVCPFFGHTPETYFVHHVGMHHEENNMDDDTSSTLPYQRDSLTDFFKYYLNFIFLGFKETFMYLLNRKKKKYYLRMTFGEGAFFALCVAMCFIYLQAALWVLIIPFLLSRLIMMLGNWTQHAFVDPNDPENMYRKDNLAKERSLVFEGIHYLHLFYFLMTKRYDKIADNLVNINNSFSSKEEVINILKQRTAKFYNRGAA
jgi:fatty acid desaturase